MTAGDGPRTLFRNIWDADVVTRLGDGGVLLSVDHYLVNEVASPQAFQGSAQRRPIRPAP